MAIQRREASNHKPNSAIGDRSKENETPDSEQYNQQRKDSPRESEEQDFPSDSTNFSYVSARNDQLEYLEEDNLEYLSLPSLDNNEEREEDGEELVGLRIFTQRTIDWDRLSMSEDEDDEYLREPRYQATTHSPNAFDCSPFSNTWVMHVPRCRRFPPRPRPSTKS